METPALPVAEVMNLMLDAVFAVDAGGRIVFASAASERIFGYTPKEMTGRAMIDMVVVDDVPKTRQAVAEAMAGIALTHFENRHIRKDGRIVHLMWSSHWSEAHQVRISVARDITEFKRAESMEDALHAISEAAHAAKNLDALFKGIHTIVDGLLPANNLFVALYDRKKDELTFPYFVDELDEAPAPRKLNLSPTLSAEVIRTGQALLVTPDSRNLIAHLSGLIGSDSIDWLGVPLISQKGVIGVLVVQSYSGEVRYTEKDKTLLQFVSTQVAAAIERKQTETLLKHMAHHDALTDLPNRELFDDRLQSALALAHRNQGRLALLCIDLDKFKQVNDTLGHLVGDILLQQVAARITGCVRASDTVGRIGGDEFLVLLNDIPVPEDAAIVARKICIALANPFEIAGHRIGIASSIGVAAYPENGIDRQQLFRHADAAMYRAKKAGGNRYVTADAPQFGMTASG